MNNFDIKKFPLLRLAIPLIVGIVIGWQCDMEMSHIVTLFAISFIALMVGLFSFSPKWLFGVGATGMMLAIGVFVISRDKEMASPEWSGERHSCVAQLLEMPRVGGAATKVQAFVVVDDSAKIPGKRSEGIVDIYFANSVEVEALCIGERIHFDAVIRKPQNRGNPAEFDVVRFMRVKGITGTLFLPVGSWESIGYGDMSLRAYALMLREKIVEMYEGLGFDGDELSLLSAFSVGEKRGFSQTLKEAYADAGVTHLLALSGLHLGIFYMLVVTLLSFMRGTRYLFVIRELLALLLLWGFAFVVGLTPSVVRSAVLFSVVGVGRCLRRDGVVLNSLAFAAMAMLLFSPRLLFDISFQLSFSAVVAIVLLTPWLQNIMRGDDYGRLYKYFSSLVAVSLAAQAGVLPFIWYYFGTFPLYFLIVNILLVPLATLLMALSVLLWILAPITFLQQGVAWGLSQLLSFVNGVVSFFSSLPAARVMLPVVGVWGCCLVILLLWSVIYGIVKRRYWLVTVSVIAGIAALMLNVFATNRDKNYILLFNSQKSASMLIVADNGNSYKFSSVPQLDSDCDRYVTPYIERERIVAPQWINNGFCCADINLSDGLLEFDDLRLQILADDCWLADSVQRPVDAVVLCRGFLGSVKELLQHYGTECVILDGSLYEVSRKRLLRECREEGVGCIDISRIGAVKIKSGNDIFMVETMAGK